MDYKTEYSLNEKDSLQDMLNLEKSLVKIYSTAMTEGCSNGFRTLIKRHWETATDDQMQVFLEMTDHGYYQVESAPEQVLKEHKQKFDPIKNQLS